MYLVKTKWWLRMLGPSLTWKMNTGNNVYLTFDDGPHPTITPFVLQCLRQYNAKATFFCVGENVQRYPGTYAQILNEGHTTGNHTHNHVSGWRVSTEVYRQSIDEAARYIDSKLFRPPYGRLTPAQTTALNDYEIIMWDVLSGDFDTRISGEQCLKNVTDNCQAGSIVVFHDSEKAFDRLEYALPKVLAFLAARNLNMLAF